jgi:hypothetical protein
VREIEIVGRRRIDEPAVAVGGEVDGHMAGRPAPVNTSSR